MSWKESVRDVLCVSAICAFLACALVTMKGCYEADTRADYERTKATLELEATKLAAEKAR